MPIYDSFTGRMATRKGAAGAAGDMLSGTRNASPSPVKSAAGAAPVVAGQRYGHDVDRAGRGRCPGEPAGAPGVPEIRPVERRLRARGAAARLAQAGAWLRPPACRLAGRPAQGPAAQGTVPARLQHPDPGPVLLDPALWLTRPAGVRQGRRADGQR